MVSVSIAMATYNGARFLEEQIDSLLNQTFRDIEIVVSDDASTDATPDILRRYADRFPEVFRIYLHENNVGYVRNFERCLHACKGEAILLCDQDDIWEQDKVSILLNALQKTQSLLIYSDAVLIDDRNHPIHSSLWEHLGLKDIGNNQAGLYLRNAVTGCTCILNKKLLDLALPIPPGFPVHDWWLAFVALQYGKLSRVENKLTLYRQHSGNALGTNILKRGENNQHKVSIARKAWDHFLSPWKKNLDRIVKSEIQAKSFQLSVYGAFAAFNEQRGLDTSISNRLEDWSKAYTTQIYLDRYRPFFDEHPELFALVEDPATMKRQVLKSMKLRQLKAVKAMGIYTLSLASLIGLVTWYFIP